MTCEQGEKCIWKESYLRMKKIADQTTENLSIHCQKSEQAKKEKEDFEAKYNKMKISYIAARDHIEILEAEKKKILKQMKKVQMENQGFEESFPCKFGESANK